MKHSITEQMLRNTALFLMVGFISLAIVLSLLMYRGVATYQARLTQDLDTQQQRNTQIIKDFFENGIEVEVIQ